VIVTGSGVRRPRVALVLADQGRTVEPDRRHTQTALQLQPELAMAYNNRGVAWRDKGDTVRALADFEAAVRSDPTLDIAIRHRQQLGRTAVAARKPAIGLHPSADASIR